MTSPRDPTPVPSPSELAAVVTSAASDAEKECAMMALRPTVERLAATVALDRPTNMGLRLCEDAFGIIWEKLTRTGEAAYDPALGRFEAWCRTVLDNEATDRMRRQAREPVDLAPTGAYGLVTTPEVEELPDRDRWTVVAEQACLVLEESLEKVRGQLDDARGEWADRGVKFYAVFLLHLRQGLVNRLSRTWAAETEDLPGGEVSSVTERCLRWHPHEELLTFRAGWPTLAAVWDELRPVADRPPYRLEGDTVCDALTRLRGGAEVTVGSWHQWTKRARARARAFIAPDAWETLFAPWLPAPRAVGRPPESDP